jgi:nuclear pore complex protein Nup155
MLLALACGNTFLEHTDANVIGNLSMLNPDVAAVAKQAFYDFGDRPVWTERQVYGKGICSIMNAI